MDNFLEDFDKGDLIFSAFQAEDLTDYQIRALLSLYKNYRKVPRETIKGATRITNDSQLSSSVIYPLIRRGYIKRGKKQGDGRVDYSLLPKGSKLIKRVRVKLGYGIDNLLEPGER